MKRLVVPKFETEAEEAQWCHHHRHAVASCFRIGAQIDPDRKSPIVLMLAQDLKGLGFHSKGIGHHINQISISETLRFRQ